MQEELKDDGSAYWEYVLLYVYGAFCISMNYEKVLNDKIGKYLLINPGSVGYPNIYLGNKISKVTLYNGFEA